MYGVLFILMLLCPATLQARGSDTPLRFDGIFEPSGVVQLSNGEIIIIEDEPGSPLWLLEPRLVKGRIVLAEKRTIVLQTPYNDLEAIAAGKNDDLFVITSHSVTKNGARKKKREKLLRIDQPTDILGIPREESTDKLLSPLVARLQQQFGVEQQEINIEGLSFDGKKERLLVGLRAPLAGKRSILLELANPYDVVSKNAPPVFSKTVIELDMGGGIRAICFDYISQRYIFANEIENSDGKKVSALWSWNVGTPSPVRLEISAIPKLKNVEGVAIISWNKKNYLLLVCDDGKKKKRKGARYLIIDYEDIL